MTDPVFTILLVTAFLAGAAVMRWFKTLDGDFLGAAATPMTAGVISGALISVAGNFHHAVVTGTVFTLSALYVRLMGRESEPSEGMLMGGVSGAAASAVSILFAGDPLLHLAQNLLAASLAAFGITFAALHVRSPGRRFIFDLITAALAIGAACLPGVAGLPIRDEAIAVTIGIPLLVLLTVLRQWPDVRAELRHEASLGFIDDEEIVRTAHPFLRFGTGGWHDRHAHREFVRLANRIALRKRQQRDRPEEVARLYQLEIIRLRMQLQEMSAINRHSARQAEGHSSDALPE